MACLLFVDFRLAVFAVCRINCMKCVERFYMMDRFYNVIVGDDSNDSFSSDDGFGEDGPPKPKWFTEKEETFSTYSDYDFLTRFRISKATASQLLDLIGYKLEFPTHKNHPISPVNQLLCALRFYATGCKQSCCAQNGGFSASTANRIIRRVSTSIADLKPIYVQFPETETSVKKAQLEFYTVAKFPKVIGVLDCTHIKIASPGGSDAELYRNIKGYFSLNVQAICNVNLEFTDIVARWPGSTNDCTVFNNCIRKVYFESERYKDAALLVDRAYDCKPYLLPPLEQVETRSENLYNESHIRTWYIAQRLFEEWKKRFPCLALGLRVDLEKAMEIIVATSILHNICRQNDDGMPPDDPDLKLPSPWEELFRSGDMQEHHADNAFNKPHPVRRALIDLYFASLL